MENIIQMLTSSLTDLHNAGLPRDSLQNPDGTPLNNAYQKITSAIIALSIEKISSAK